MDPGRLATREFVPAKNNKNGTHTEAADQQSEIGMFGQRLEHDIRLTHRAVTRQREDRLEERIGVSAYRRIGVGA